MGTYFLFKRISFNKEYEMNYRCFTNPNEILDLNSISSVAATGSWESDRELYNEWVMLITFEFADHF